MKLIQTMLEWFIVVPAVIAVGFFVVPAVIAVGFFAVMAAVFVLIAFTPFWILSSIVDMFGGKDEV